MLGRRLLKRLTRLGLAAYAMTYCMAFTVCASENPVADLMVADTVQVLAVEDEQSDILMPGEDEADEPAQIITDDGVNDLIPVSEGGQSEALITNDELSRGEEEPDSFKQAVPEESGNPAELNNEGAAGPSYSPNTVYLNDTVSGIFNVTRKNLNDEIILNVKGYDQGGNEDTDSNKYKVGLYMDEQGNTPVSKNFPVLLDTGWLPGCWLSVNGTKESTAFYVVAKYEYASGKTATASWKIVVDLYDYNVNNLKIVGSVGAGADVTAGGNYSFSLISDPANASLNPERIDWGLKYHNRTNASILLKELDGVKLMFNKTQAWISTADVSRTVDIDLVARYYKEEPNFNTTQEAENVAAVCPLRIVAMAGDDYYVHLSDKSVKVELFKSFNTIPVTIRNSNFTEEIGDYRVLKAEFTNAILNKHDLFNISITEDGKTLNIRAGESLVNGGAESFMKEYKKGITTGLMVKAEVDGKTIKEPLTADSNITITFGSTKPTAKDIKSVGTIDFNSYRAGMEGYNITFAGPEVGSIMASATPKDEAAYNKSGLTVDSKTATIRSTEQMPAKGSGKLNVLVFLNDTEYNLPSNFNISVPVSYKVKNDAPVISLNETSVLLNTGKAGIRTVDFSLKGVALNTSLNCSIFDSKGNAANDDITFNFRRSNDHGVISFNSTNSTKPGAVYKAVIIPYNRQNGREGAAQTVTVKTSTNEAGYKIGAKQDGQLDASLACNSLKIDLDCKNYDLTGEHPSWFNITCNGEDITGLFTEPSIGKDSKGKPYLELNTDDHKPLCLLPYAGQKYLAEIYYGTLNTSVSIQGKIANSAVTPKLESDKISINPEVNLNQTIKVGLSEPVGEEYGFNITSDDTPFDISVQDDGYGSHYVCIETGGDMSSAFGKTFKVVLTPTIAPGLNGTVNTKPATLKIEVLDPVKKPGSMTATVKGKIDAVRDDTYVTAAISFKNLYEPVDGLEIEEFNCTDIVLRKGRTTPVSCREDFAVEADTEDKVIMFFRSPDHDIQAGNYEASIEALLDNGQTLNGTIKFKVVRGKTNTVVKPSPAVLINRDNARYTTVYFSPKKNDANTMLNATIVADKNKFDKYFSLEPVKGKPGAYMLRVQKGYYEQQVKKGVVSLITKVVSKSVKVKVYYEGSSVPETVTMKVKIKP